MAVLVPFRGRRFPSTTVAFLGVALLASGPAVAQNAVCLNTGPAENPVKPSHIDKNQRKNRPNWGTLGYGPPGIFPGFQGFGLGFHLGYGYGGDGLGPGADGGYPYYSGPGYPHPWPRLRRIGGIVPFPYYGGPGAPTPECRNYFGGLGGPLVNDQPVIEIEPEPEEAAYGTGFGPVTGVLPYPESFLAPFTTRAAIGGSRSGVSTENPAPAPSNMPAATGPVPGMPSGVPPLGLEAITVGAENARVLRLTRVYPGSPAEQAGLHVGDEIVSANGFLTPEPGNLAWVVANKAPDRVVTLNVRPGAGGNEQPLTVKLP